ncbi:MAG TPA: hypothetical protein DD726_09070, partial [Phycisphaerales bacterium]|nr:hypothetical protein [Phycisphaerales bacterium]
ENLNGVVVINFCLCPAIPAIYSSGKEAKNKAKMLKSTIFSKLLKKSRSMLYLTSGYWRRRVL